VSAGQGSFAARNGTDDFATLGFNPQKPQRERGKTPVGQLRNYTVKFSEAGSDAMRMWRGLAAGLAQVAVLAALLLIPAGLVPGGTWLWPHGLWFVGVYGAITLASTMGLAVLRPDNFAVRQESVVADRGKKQPLIDAVGSAVLVVFAAGWLAFVPLDVFDLHLLAAPGPVAMALGGVSALIGAALINLAVWQNRFATPNLQDQSERGQRVIDSGIYALIRHPIYSGNFWLFGGLSVWLGSYAALAGLAVLAIATAARIAMEERHLMANLPGYEDYARRVRGRLIPYLL
jgi:protein-S-isoprenylcysteine O-methyltransferase Ste14